MLLIDKYGKFLEEYKSELACLVFDGPSARDHIAGTMLAKQFDLAYSVEILGRRETLTGIPILMRSIYEASNDLKLHLKDEKHLKQLFFEELKRERTAAVNARAAPQDSLLRSLYDSEESIQAILAEFERAELRAKELGLKKHQSIKHVFRDLGSETDYDSLYAFLSKYVHTSPKMLDKSYAPISNGQAKSMLLHPAFNPVHLKGYLSATMEILVDSLTAFWSYKGIAKPAAIKSFRVMQRSL
ncbi:DUF5677 domain-containing protein [Turneriella parva]|uniref:Uncharacterized protein n=1 Tax=Turneriella parva (strain ATCC BAA-1111 / DSM 21527 / NCTC 11395 / H) TaxID=869212 RepID=I4B493_TURPD|nr:DUF5677 domain-containing protein [Turneriella parva]AFM12100.1 hypothetical protein Turpa_1452 [Turneriella parva DSM 21527]